VNCGHARPIVHSPFDICVCGEPWWNDIDGETKELGEKPVPLPLC
jgi:hypothetical protein